MGQLRMAQIDNLTPDEWQLVTKALYTLNMLDPENRDLSRDEQAAAFALAERIRNAH